jgi:hypothetical protein
MPNNIILKKSSIVDKVPLPGDLQYGELALNYTDGNLFYKNSSNAISTIASNKSVSVTGNVTGNNFFGNGSTLSNINAFGTIVVAGQSNVVANSSSGTLTLVGGTGVTVSTNAATDTITITAQDQNSGADIFQTGGSMGLITEAVTSQGDLGLVSQVASSLINMGTIVISGLIYPTEFKLPSYTVAGLPSASALGLMIFVTNAAGGSVPAFSDGTNWRSVTDRSIIT